MFRLLVREESIDGPILDDGAKSCSDPSQVWRKRKEISSHRANELALYQSGNERKRAACENKEAEADRKHDGRLRIPSLVTLKILDDHVLQLPVTPEEEEKGVYEPLLYDRKHQDRHVCHAEDH